MNAYIIRIVLHGAIAAQYTKLHDLMLQNGASRHIVGSDGMKYDLPDGEYVLVSSYTVAQLRDAIVQIATSVKAKPDPSVIVAAYSDIAWQLRPFPGQS